MSPNSASRFAWEDGDVEVLSEGNTPAESQPSPPKVKEQPKPPKPPKFIVRLGR